MLELQRVNRLQNHLRDGRQSCGKYNIHVTHRIIMLYVVVLYGYVVPVNRINDAKGQSGARETINFI